MENRRIDKRETADRNVGFLLSDAARLMRTNYDRRMRELGITRSQWWVLNNLYFNEGISQTALSDVLEIERATLGRLIDRLEEKGWIERRSDRRDRRVKRVFLTGEVEMLLQTMRSIAAECRSQALAGVSREQQEWFIDMLLQVKSNLQRATENVVEVANDAEPEREVAHG
jgi:DNA-binding MarR family transcriptional regulator